MGQTELVLAVWAAVTVLASSDVPGGYYHSKYDYVDIDDILNHKRLVQHYAACLLNRGPCPPEGADLKRILPEALQTDCLRCTEKQRDIIYKVIQRLREEYSSLWKEVSDVYDPTGELVTRFQNVYNKKTSVQDQANLLTNRFSDDASANDIVPVANLDSGAHVYPGASPTATTTTTARPFTSQTASTTTTTGTKSKPYPESSSTKPPSFVTVWQYQATTKPPSFGWRPAESTTQLIYYRPFQTIRPLGNIPILNVDTGVRILGSISDIGNKVLQAGSQVAGMVLSTVQALVGQ